MLGGEKRNMPYEWGNVWEQVNKDEYEENTACSSSIYLGNSHDVGGVETENNYEGANF